MDSRIIVLGDVVRGHGAASSHTVVRQLPHFISLVPKMAELAGIGYGHLCRIHIREAWVKDGLIIVGPENCLATDLQSDL